MGPKKKGRRSKEKGRESRDVNQLAALDELHLGHSNDGGDEQNVGPVIPFLPAKKSEKDLKAYLHPPCPQREALSGICGREYGVILLFTAGETCEEDLRDDLSRSIFNRYSLVPHLEDGRYCFYDPDEVTSPEQMEHFPIIIHDVFDAISVTSGLDPARLSVLECENSWMNLNRKGKANLYRIMNTPLCLWYSLKYCTQEKRWRPRDSPGQADCVVLTSYGAPAARNYNSFTERLMADLKPEDLKPHRHLGLVKYWNSALKEGMGNDEGRTAVFQLFEHLVHLLPHMNIFTAVEIYHKTYTCREDGCCVSDTSSCSSLENICKQKLSQSSCSSCSSLENTPKQKSPQPSASSKAQMATHKQLPDMVLLCRDEISGFAKYLALIETRSKGKDDPKAQEKFLKEVVCVLQGQDAVFGFLFSVSDVIYYFAKREVSGNISVEQFRYPLAWTKAYEKFWNFHVGSFQMLIMDLLSALVYGIQKFQV